MFCVCANIFLLSEIKIVETCHLSCNAIFELLADFESVTKRSHPMSSMEKHHLGTSLKMSMQS